MKKFLALALALVMSMSLVACGNKTEDEVKEPVADEQQEEVTNTEDMRVAMITDYGDITDQSFNQTTYEACKAYSEAHGLDFKYYKPAADSTADRVASVEQAIDEDFNVIVMPGFAFAGSPPVFLRRSGPDWTADFPSPPPGQRQWKCWAALQRCCAPPTIFWAWNTARRCWNRIHPCARWCSAGPAAITTKFPIL